MDSGVPDLLPESRARRARLHWIVFGRAAFALLVGAVFILNRHPLLALPFVAAGIGFAVAAVLRTRSFRLELEDDTVTAALGVRGRVQVEVPLARLRSIAVLQGPIARLLGYGTVAVTSSTGGETTFRSVADPYAFRLAVLRRIDDMQTRTTEVVPRRRHE